MASRYFVGGGSSTNWDAVTPTNWSATDGGGNDASVPASGDDVFFKSAADCVHNVNTADLNSFNMTGYTGTFSGNKYIIVAPTTGTVTVLVAGTWTHTGTFALEPIGIATVINFTSGGKTIGKISNWFGTGTGTVEQQDALAITSTFTVYEGTWNTNGFSVSCLGVVLVASCNLFNCTNSTITCSTSGWNCAAAALTATGSTINVTGTSQFTGGNKTYNIVTFSGDSILITGSNTFATLNVNTAGLATGLKFLINSTQTVTNFATNGSVGNLAKIISSSAGSHFHLTTGSAQISVDYMSIKDSVANQANVWYAGANSTDVSGNSGWIFTAPPSGVVAKRFFIKNPGAFNLLFGDGEWH